MIKIIKGLEPWEVMKRASEGEEVALYKNGKWIRIGLPIWNWCEFIYGIIEKPEVIEGWLTTYKYDDTLLVFFDKTFDEAKKNRRTNDTFFSCEPIKLTRGEDLDNEQG